VSLLTIGAQAMMDSYLCLIHLTTGILAESIFNAFATAAFFKFVTFSFYEMRYLMVIWKARRAQAFTDWNTTRAEFGKLYTRFYIGLMMGFMAIYYINGLFKLFVFVLYSFLIPQIVCNATRDSNKALNWQYVIGAVCTRLLIPLYFYGCPYNFIHAEPDYTFLSYLLSWVLLQVIVLFLQDSLGPRFFIPRRCLPPKYDYHRAVTLRGGDTLECVICMSSIDTASKDYMVTPCEHVFHTICLLQWFNQKMECPTCRGALPNYSPV